MDIYDKLKELYVEICARYKGLYRMECCRIKDSSLFKKRLEELKLAVKTEKKLLDELVRSDDYVWVKNEIFSCVEKDEFYLRMRDYFIFFESTNADILMDDDEEVIDTKTKGVKVAKIFNISAKNIFLLYAYFLDMTVDKLVITGLKERLLNIKYYSCIVKHNMEEVMLKYDFNVPDEIYVDLNMLVDTLNLDDEFSECAILDSYVTSINGSIEQLMSKTDKEYSSDDNLLALSLNYQCMLKACLAMIGEHEYNMINSLVIKKIRELSTEDNMGSVKNILDIINNRNEYRSNVRKLSFKPLRYN